MRDDPAEQARLESEWAKERSERWPTPTPGPRRLNPIPETLSSGFDMSFFRQEVPGGWLYTVVVKGEHPALTTTFVKDPPSPQEGP